LTSSVRVLDISENHKLVFSNFQELNQKCPNLETLLMRSLKSYFFKENEEQIVFENLLRFDISETFKGTSGDKFVELFLRPNLFPKMEMLIFDDNHLSAHWFSKILSCQGLK
jgi:hypothetical protein